MDRPHGPEFNTSSDKGLEDSLDPDFCLAVFDRQLTPQELDVNYFHIRVDDIDTALLALQNYPEWEVLGKHEGMFSMKIAIAHRFSDDPSQYLSIFFYEDLLDPEVK